MRIYNRWQHAKKTTMKDDNYKTLIAIAGTNLVRLAALRTPDIASRGKWHITWRRPSLNL